MKRTTFRLALTLGTIAALISAAGAPRYFFSS